MWNPVPWFVVLIMLVSRRKQLFACYNPELQRTSEYEQGVWKEIWRDSTRGKNIRIKYDNKNGWNYEAFRDRYSDVLDRYDYIVGDWGYNQLRLKGFFREGNPKGSKESSIASLQEYIQEYCNFGCAYFVLERIPNKKRTILRLEDRTTAARTQA